jgi:uncharacterized protein YecT (DUF1311 family)
MNINIYRTCIYKGYRANYEDEELNRAYRSLYTRKKGLVSKQANEQSYVLGKLNKRALPNVMIVLKGRCIPQANGRMVQ